MVRTFPSQKQRALERNTVLEYRDYFQWVDELFEQWQVAAPDKRSVIFSWHPTGALHASTSPLLSIESTVESGQQLNSLLVVLPRTSLKLEYLTEHTVSGADWAADESIIFREHIYQAAQRGSGVIRRRLLKTVVICYSVSLLHNTLEKASRQLNCCSSYTTESGVVSPPSPSDRVKVTVFWMTSTGMLKVSVFSTILLNIMTFM